jgi:hypothetical protein
MSWWEREINIWRLYGSPNDHEEIDVPELESSVRTRRLVARIAVKVSLTHRER